MLVTECDLDSSYKNPCEKSPGCDRYTKSNDTNARPKATPTAATIKTSCWFVFAMISISLGTIFDPNTKTTAINPMVTPTDIAISFTDMLPLVPIDWNIANKEMISMSSMMAVPRIKVADSSLIMLSSPNTLITITVLVTEIDKAYEQAIVKSQPQGLGHKKANR